MVTLLKRQQATRKVEELAKLEQLSSLLFRGSLIFLLICISYGVWTLIHDVHYFPVRKVHIIGNFRHLEQHQLKEVISPIINEGFFNMDLSLLKTNLENIPWVAQADIKRIWPNGVEIQIIEHKPIAIWDDDSLLSSEGIVFTPSKKSVVNNLPRFSAPSGQQLLMLDTYRQMALLLANLDLQIREMDLSTRLAWRLHLNNGIELILGHENVFARLQRFIKVYPRMLANKVQLIDYVDLRYPNGMAVKWHSAQAE